MTKEEFEEKESFLDLLHAYLARINHKRPAVGQYDARPIEKHLPEIDFDKMQSRAQYYDEDFEAERDKEGDVLILDPHRPQEHVPGFEM